MAAADTVRIAQLDLAGIEVAGTVLVAEHIAVDYYGLARQYLPVAPLESRYQIAHRGPVE